MRIYIPFIGMAVVSLIFGSIFLPTVYAEDKKPPSRQKVIDFEGDLVEGVNKQPLDSLSEISEAQKRKRKMHLYRKRKGFKTEIQETLREMRYPQ